jgi:hypothetical protein
MGETAEDLRNCRGFYKAALFETDTSNCHDTSKNRGKLSSFDPESYFETSPNYDGETEAIDNALYALQALENCVRSTTKDRRHAPRAG